MNRFRFVVAVTLIAGLGGAIVGCSGGTKNVVATPSPDGGGDSTTGSQREKAAPPDDAAGDVIQDSASTNDGTPGNDASSEASGDSALVDSSSDAPMDGAPDAGSDGGMSDSGGDGASGTICQSLHIPVGGGAMVNGSAALMPAGNACYEAWIDLDNTKQSPVILADCTASNVCDAALTVRDDQGLVHFAVQNDAGLLTASYAVNPHDNAWHHVAGCRAISASNVTLTLFWDGQLQSTVTGTTSQIGAPSDLRLGSISYATTDGLGGFIDEVRVSNTLRYSGTFTPQTRFVNDASTVVLLHFDSVTASSFVDSSSNSLSGSLLGTAVAAPVCVSAAPPTCSSFTYSDWGACQPNGTQTRAVVSPSPSGCTGGSPVLSQSCTYVFAVACSGPTPSITDACGVPDPYTYSIMNGVAYLNIDSQTAIDSQSVSMACTINASSNTAQCPLNAIWYGAPNRTLTYTYNPVSGVVSVEMYNPDAPNSPCYWSEPCNVSDGGADGG